MKTTIAEVNQFNREWEEFEIWKNGIEEKIRPERSYYFREDAPDEPWWFKNLQKAWSSTQRKKALTEAIQERDNGEPELPSIEEIRQNPNAWQTYCESREIKRPVGRPRLSEDKKVNRQIPKKRSDKMREMLEDHGYTVEDGYVYDNLGSRWGFMPNGRIRLEDESSISVHAFLRKFT